MLMTKVKVKTCYFIFYLCSQQYFLETSAGIHGIRKEYVAKYLIQRKAFRSQDEFSVLFNQRCHDQHDQKPRCNPTCTDLSAEDPTASLKNFNRTCSCPYQSSTFLPEEGKCIPDNQTANKLKAPPTRGCSRYMQSWIDLFLNGLELSKNGNRSSYLPDRSFQSCKVIPSSPMYYDSLESGWKKISSQMFTVRYQQDKGVVLEWQADANDILSGRILRLAVTCNYTNVDKPPLNGCLLFKAVGSVTYNYINQSVAQESGYPSSTISSLVPTVSTLHVSRSVASFLPSSPSSILPWPSSSSSSSASSSSSSSSSASLSSLNTPTTPETRNTESLSSSEGLQTTGASTTILKPAVKTNVFSINPSKPSLPAKVASSSAVIEHPGNKKARVNGNDNGVVIGAAVGGTAVCGIFVIILIVFCKRRKPWRNKEKTTKLQVKNPVYGSPDIPLSSPVENHVSTLMDQDSQPRYQDLTTDNGKMSGAAIYSNPDGNDYDNSYYCSDYQSLDKKVPRSPVYQSLTKGQLNTGKPTSKSKPSVSGPPTERSKDAAEPVYHVVEQPDTEQGTMPEKENGVPEHDSDQHIEEPVYNVLDGSGTERNYETSDVGDSLYNMLEEPESMQDQQQPLYNVLESSDAEKSSHQGAQGSCGLSNEPLYNVVEGPDSDGSNENGVGYDAPHGSFSSDAHDNPAYEQSLDFGPNKSGAGCAAPSGSSPLDAHDNPAYEQSLDFDVPYASVQRPGPQRESVYEPLRGPNDQELYEPLK